MQTDVAVLKQRGLEVSCVNISCGYYNPHTNEEYTKIADLNKCHQLVKHIIETCTERYEHHYVPYNSWFSRYSIQYPYGLGTSFDFEEKDPICRRHENKSISKRDYDSLLNVISNRLAFDSFLKVDDLVELFKDCFPQAIRHDYETAYNEIMGIV